MEVEKLETEDGMQGAAIDDSVEWEEDETGN